jgi:predicted GNAT family N-acyltransferase
MVPEASSGRLTNSQEAQVGVDVEDQLTLRAMTKDDLRSAAELSLDQSWPHREEDWELFLKTGEGFVWEREGRVLGTALVWRYGEDHAGLGMVIVQEEERGKGLARRMIEGMLERLEGRTVFLNTTEVGVDLFRKLGFVERGRIFQHQGFAPTMPLADLVPNERVRPIGGADKDIPALYSRASGMDRSRLFEVLAASGPTVVLERDYEPVGFAMMRRFGHGRQIGPIVAPDLQGAQALATHFLGSKAGSFCRIDAVEGTGFSEWLTGVGFPAVGSVRTMVRGPFSGGSGPAQVFGIPAQAYGS